MLCFATYGSIGRRERQQVPLNKVSCGLFTTFRRNSCDALNAGVRSQERAMLRIPKTKSDRAYRQKCAVILGNRIYTGVQSIFSCPFLWGSITKMSKLLWFISGVKRQTEAQKDQVLFNNWYILRLSWFNSWFRSTNKLQSSNFLE